MQTESPDSTADIDRSVRELLTIFYGYHQGPSPRVGARVRCKGLPGTVFGHDRFESVFVVLDNGDRKKLKRGESTIIGSRKTLSEFLELAASLALEFQDTVALSQLIAHFRGDNGSQYTSRTAFLWSIHALCHLLAARGRSTRVSCWLNTQIEQEHERALLPPLIDTDLLASVPGSEVEADAFAGLRTIALHSVRRSLDEGEKSLTLARADAPLEVDVTQLSRRLATDLQTEQPLVIIGPAAVVTSGHVDVIDLDSLWSFTRHISGLEVSEESIDPPWFWDVVTQAAAKNPKSLASTWLGMSLKGPDGVEVETLERRRAAALGSLIGLRHAVSRNARGAIKRFIKDAKAHARALPKAEFARLVALAPELVAPSIGTSFRLSPADSIAPAMQEAVKQLLEALPAPDTESLGIAKGQKWAAGPVLQDEIGFEASAPATTAAPAVRPEKIRFKTAKRPLRFEVTEHALLAMEWQLVEEPGAHAGAVATALQWLERRLDTSLPKTWREGGHEIERAGATVQVEAAENLFAFRLEHPDLDQPTRWWRVEATVIAGLRDVGGMVGVRLSVRDFVKLAPPHSSIPGLVRAWAESPGLLLGGAPSGHVSSLSEREHIDQFGELVSREDRETPLVVAPIDGGRLPVRGSISGLARVFSTSSSAGIYSELYGELYSGRVHIFPPRAHRPESFSISTKGWEERLRLRLMHLRQNYETPTFREVRDTIHEHRIWRQAERSNTDHHPAVTSELSDVVLVSDASQEAVDLARKATPHLPSVEPVVPDEPTLSAGELRQLVRREVRDYEELLEVAEAERDDAIAARDHAESEAIALRHYLAQLSNRLHAARDGIPSFPTSLNEMRSWSTTIAPRIAFPEKVLRFNEGCEHNEVPKIYSALQALHDFYWPMRFGTEEEVRASSHSRWQDFLQNQRLRWTPVGAAVRTGRYRDEYRATLDGTTYDASMHLAGNSATDPLRCLRIYVAIDEDLERLVVIHLPTHLTNSLT